MDGFSVEGSGVLGREAHRMGVADFGAAQGPGGSVGNGLVIVENPSIGERELEDVLAFGDWQIEQERGE